MKKLKAKDIPFALSFLFIVKSQVAFALFLPVILVPELALSFLL
jgi:hypothetical protein